MYLYRHWWPDATILGFDSFAGLPEEQSGEVRRATWNKGTFNVEATVYDRVLRDLGPPPLTQLYKGYFNESLTQRLGKRLSKQLPPATLVDIDSDIYVSAYQALDWLFTHKLIVPGTVVAYDDWADYVCSPMLTREELKSVPRRQVVDAMKMGIHKSRDPKQPPSELSKLVKASKAAERFPKLFAAGEPKAHLEITKKHKVEFRCLAGSCKAASSWKTCDAHKTYGAMFVVTAVGGEGPPQHGVEMLDTQSGLKSFRKHNAACVWVSEMRFSTEAKDAPVV